MPDTRFNFQNRLHVTYTVTGLFALSGEGNVYIKDSTGVFLHDVNFWSQEWNKRMYCATRSGVVLNYLPFGTSGNI